MRYFLCFFILAIISFTDAVAQEFPALMKNMVAKYSAIKNALIEVDVRVHEYKGSSNVMYRFRGSVRKKNNLFLSQTDDAEMLMTESTLLIVDKKSKEILVSSRDVKGETAFFNPFEISIDSIMRFYEKPELVGSSGDIVHYVLKQKVGDIKLVEMFISRIDSAMTRAEYTMKTNQHVVIDYVTFNCHPVFTASTFDLAHYINDTDNRVISPSLFFRGYKIRDNRKMQ